MTDKLKLIKSRQKFDDERFSNVPKKVLEQSSEYHRHLEAGFLINKINELEQDLIGNNE